MRSRRWRAGREATDMRLAVLAAGVLATSAAWAQLNPGITDPEMLDPWRQAAAVVQSIPAATHQASLVEATKLDEALAKLQARLEDTAIHIVARPEFSYDAAQWSFELGEEV